MKSLAAFFALLVASGVAAACAAEPPEPILLGRCPRDAATHHIAFSPDGKWLAGPGIVIWDMTTKEEVARLQNGQSGGGFFQFSPDSHRLAASCWDNVDLWDGRQGWERATKKQLVKATPEEAKRHQWPRSGLWWCPPAFSPDGKILAVTSSSQVVRIVRASDGQQIGTLSVGGTPAGLGFVQKGKTLIVAAYMPPERSGGDVVQFWDMESLTRSRSINVGRKGIHRPVISRDEKRIAALIGRGDGRADLGICEIQSGKWTILAGDTPYDGAVAFSPDGRLLAATPYRSPLVLLGDLGKRTLEATLKTPGGLVWSIAFSPDGKHLAAGLWQSTTPICLWELQPATNKTE
jgi:WD40 repeat protein